MINQAKKKGFYQQKKKRIPHDREVLTQYAGELVQHDSSHHKFAPHAESKWYLITSLDDYSRHLLYTELYDRETTWAHILALKYVILVYGIGKTLDGFFCLRTRRFVDAYHNISVNNLKFPIHKAPLREEIQINFVPYTEEDRADLRIWYRDTFTDLYTVKAWDLVPF